jgi:putative copper export protein
MPLNKTLTIIIGFIHDFAAGCWGATVLAVYWLDQQTLPHDLHGIILGMKKQFFYGGLACVFLVFATGAGRTFTYVGNVYGRDAEKVRRNMLIAKHILLLTVFSAGIYWQYVMVYN